MANSDKKPARRRRPTAKTPEARENQLISLAMNVAEERMLDGTASNALIIHYLKLGSTRERMEKELMQKHMKKLDAQTESIESSQRIEAMYAQAIDAMRMYSGQRPLHDDDEDEEPIF